MPDANRALSGHGPRHNNWHWYHSPFVARRSWAGAWRGDTRRDLNTTLTNQKATAARDSCCCHVQYSRPGPVTLLHSSPSSPRRITVWAQGPKEEKTQNIAARLLRRRLGGEEEATHGLQLDHRHDPKHGLARTSDGGPIATAGIERPACSTQ